MRAGILFHQTHEATGSTEGSLRETPNLIKGYFYDDHVTYLLTLSLLKFPWTTTGYGKQKLLYNRVHGYLKVYSKKR